MNNYDDFISQVGNVSKFPQNSYSKIRFRIVAGKIIISTSFIVPIFCAFLAVFMLNGYQEPQDFDITANAEEVLFGYAQNENLYSLFYDFGGGGGGFL